MLNDFHKRKIIITAVCREGDERSSSRTLEKCWGPKSAEEVVKEAADIEVDR